MTITIRHDHENGTVLDGSHKGDGVLDVVKRYGFTWRPAVGIHIRGSRDTWSWQHNLGAAADALRAAGHEVTVEVDDTWRPAAVRWAERGERVEARVDRLEERAGRAQARSDTARAAAERIADGMPFGEPIKVGHHSEAGHRRAFEKIDNGMRKAINEGDYARHLADRAEGSAATEAAKHDPRAMARRIETLNTQIRAADRALAEPRGDLSRSRWQAERDRDAEEVTYLEGILAEHVETGTFVAWGPEHFVAGDRVKVLGHWYPVKRINKKTLGLDNAGCYPSTVPWDKIGGRRRGDLQWDTPNGTPWPVADADTVTRWNAIAQRAAVNQYGDDAMRIRIRYQRTLRIALGLDLQAGDPEVSACLPSGNDTAAVRAFAILCYEIHKRLGTGEPVPDIVASTRPFPATPKWRIPTDRQPGDVRVDQLAPGDLVAGVWDRDSMAAAGRRLRTGVQGPVTAVSTVRDRRERGTWVTVTIDDDDHDYSTHIWTAAYRAGTWETASPRPAAGPLNPGGRP